MNPLPVLAAAKNAVCVAVMGILESERGTPDRLQVLKAEHEIKLSRSAGLASRSDNQTTTENLPGRQGRSLIYSMHKTKYFWLNKL